MESLCFLFECLSLSKKRKRTCEYEDEGIRHRRPKRFSLTKTSESNVIGLQNIREKIRLERSDGLPEMDAGVTPLLKGNEMEVDEDVEEIGRNLPRDKSNNRQRRIATNPEPNQHLSVRNTNRFKTLPTGSNGKGHQTRQPDRGNCLKNLLVVNLSDRGRIVELTGIGSKPNVTAEERKDLRSLLDLKRKEKVEGVQQDLRSFLDSRRRGKFPHSNKPPEYL
ncbi:hypothetical protein DAPPUDRAFT_101017 [Daphnia pulex]|uniref:Uncharacterized protein n=1 Tax=Daphnia pulex TaxID=6669 RepID=E9GBZ2_DAPPU|nr:hypothetical protein DAPPUDRAFT_101017 [Daphnia pulex]|eukprot:EFX83041.1 hypothetical protein DAPPUDRAFT_101017 [Daphnia pulex]